MVFGGGITEQSGTLEQVDTRVGVDSAHLLKDNHDAQKLVLPEAAGGSVNDVGPINGQCLSSRELLLCLGAEASSNRPATSVSHWGLRATDDPS